MALLAPGAAALGTLLAGAPDVNWPQFFAVIHWIQAVMAALSVIGSSSMIGYAVFQQTARSPEVRPLFYLSLSDLFLGVCWITGALLYSTETTKSTTQEAACYYLQAAGQIFYVASFLYTVNYTWHLYTDLKVKYNQSLYCRSPQVREWHGSIPEEFGATGLIHDGIVTLDHDNSTPAWPGREWREAPLLLSSAASQQHPWGAGISAGNRRTRMRFRESPRLEDKLNKYSTRPAISNGAFTPGYAQNWLEADATLQHKAAFVRLFLVETAISGSANHFGRITIVLSSLIPVLLMAPALGLGNRYECYRNFTAKHGCLLMHTETDLVVSHQEPTCSAMYFYGLGVFLVSFLASFVAILVLLIRARALYKKFVNSTGFVGDQQWAMVKMVEQGVVLYPIVFFCCWGPAFLLGIIKLTLLENTRMFMALYVLEALTASSQGLLNCTVYGWTQHMFRCMKRKACRDVDTQTPLLRSQKRFYASTLPTTSQGAPRSTSTVF